MAASKGALQHGDRAAREVSNRVGGLFASTAALTALSAKYRADGMIAVITTQVWIYNASSTAGASATCLVPDDNPTAGRWITNTGSTSIEASTVPVGAGTAAVGAAGTTSDSAHVHPPVVVHPLSYAGDAAAADTLAEREESYITNASTITAFKLVPTGAVTANNTTYATITINKRNGSGGTATAMASLVTTVAGGSWVAFTTKDMGTVTGGACAAGTILTLTIAKASTGVQLPSFKIFPIFG